MRQSIMNAIADVIGFGKVLATSLGASTSVVAEVEGDEGEASGTDNEVWGDAAILSRPAAPTVDGHCETLHCQLGSEKVVFATKDRRWQISVAEGEVIVRAMGPGSPAYVHLKPDGSAIVKATSINLGGSATQYVALANLVHAELVKIWKAIESHIHAGVTAGGGVTGPPSSIIAPTVVAGWANLATTVTTPGTVAATKTKAE